MEDVRGHAREDDVNTSHAPCAPHELSSARSHAPHTTFICFFSDNGKVCRGRVMRGAQRLEGASWPDDGEVAVHGMVDDKKDG